jgi:lincosamide and streptogramin A transport system ATP-binding/permease protein
VPQDTSGISGTLKEIEQRENIDITQYFTLLRKLDFSRDMLEKDIKYYSEGQKKKALLAASLCKSANLYIWDEPLNYIDILSRIQIEEAIKKYQPSMLFVEHDISFNNTVATRQILI